MPTLPSLRLLCKETSRDLPRVSSRGTWEWTCHMTNVPSSSDHNYSVAVGTRSHYEGPIFQFVRVTTYPVCG